MKALRYGMVLTALSFAAMLVGGGFGYGGGAWW